MSEKQRVTNSVTGIGKQLEKALEGLTDADGDKKINDNLMSASETMAHLAECCAAFCTTAAGGTHDWGTYESGESTLSGNLANWKKERAAAMAVLEASDNPEDLDHAMDYMTIHDAYHVGQLCALRLTLDPDWDAHAIYS
jgi:uncharacterized damage-inducible protein DinB